MSEASIEPAIRSLLGAIDVDGGATDEQRSVLDAIVGDYWGRDVGALTSMAPLEPDATAATIVDPPERRRLTHLMVLLELCRHPLTPAQTERVESYAAAMSTAGPGVEIARDLVRSGAAAATADYYRFFGSQAGVLSEPQLGADYPLELAEPDLELVGRLEAWRELPEETLGHQFLAFHDRNGFELPGQSTRFAAVFLSHDMCHVIGGYEPTGQGEIALGAMQLAMTDDETHWIQLLGNLAVHEAGFLLSESLTPKPGALTRPGATALLAEALDRGAACTGDFTKADHLAMAEWALADVREEFGVPPLKETPQR